MTAIAAPADIVSDIVNNRIGASVARPYQTAIDQIVATLVARDGEIGEFLMERAEEMDLDPAKVRPVLVEAGLLAAPALAAVEDVADDEPMPAWASTLMSRLDALEDVARRAGYPVR